MVLSLVSFSCLAVFYCEKIACACFKLKPMRQTTLCENQFSNYSPFSLINLLHNFFSNENPKYKPACNYVSCTQKKTKLLHFLHAFLKCFSHYTQKNGSYFWNYSRYRSNLSKNSQLKPTEWWIQKLNMFASAQKMVNILASKNDSNENNCSWLSTFNSFLPVRILMSGATKNGTKIHTSSPSSMRKLKSSVVLLLLLLFVSLSSARFKIHRSDGHGQPFQLNFQPMRQVKIDVKFRWTCFENVWNEQKIAPNFS